MVCSTRSGHHCFDPNGLGSVPPHNDPITFIFHHTISLLPLIALVRRGLCDESDGLRKARRRAPRPRCGRQVASPQVEAESRVNPACGAPRARECAPLCSGSRPTAQEGSMPTVSVGPLRVSTRDRARPRRHSPRETRDWMAPRETFADACWGDALPHSRPAGSSPTPHGSVRRPRPRA